MSSLNLNKVILVGRLTAEPELKQTNSGLSFIRFTVAVNRRRARNAEQNEQQADFITVTAWRQTAEFISKYFRKGSAICVTGSIQTRTWQDTQGQKRYATDIVADEVMFVDSRSESGNAFGGDDSDAFGGSTPSFSTPAGAAPKFEEIKTDDDLPF